MSEMQVNHKGILSRDKQNVSFISFPFCKFALQNENANYRECIFYE